MSQAAFELQRTVPEFWKETLGKKQFSDICLLSDENPKGILGISVYHDPENTFYYIAAATSAACPLACLLQCRCGWYWFYMGVAWAAGRKFKNLAPVFML